MRQLFQRKGINRFRLAATLLLLSTSGSQLTVLADNEKKPAKPTQQSQQAPESVPNQLLVIVHAGADKDEVSDALKKVNGTIVRNMTNGRITCYLIEVPQGKLDDAMKKLSKEKELFESVSKNIVARRQ